MKTITMYELLGLVKDGKAPSKIKYINLIWKYDKETKDYFNKDLWLIYSMNSIGLIEREVEIIEEEKKIPEKLSTKTPFDDKEKEDFIFKNRLKINEIIDYLKIKGDE